MPRESRLTLTVTKRSLAVATWDCEGLPARRAPYTYM